MPLQIFVPFYGDPALLHRTVGSVLDQTDPDWTLTVVDDGYPDPAVAAWFAALPDPRVRYLRNEVNLGANGNYRKCLTLADADLLVVLGADDELLPHYVATVRAAHASFPAAVVIQPGVEVIDEHGAPSRSLLDTVKQRLLRPRTENGRRILGGEQLAASLLRGNWLYFPSLVLARREAQRTGFRAGLDVVQDLALVLDLVAAGGGLLLDDTVCFRYRRHRASDSSWRALAGTRFVEEREFFLTAAAEAAARGWPLAARAARRHLLSRLNALTQLPRAVLARQWTGAATLTRHVVGRPR